MSHTLATVIIVLEVTGSVLLAILLATPAPKHAIVNALLVAVLLRAIWAVVPVLMFESIPQAFGSGVLVHHPVLQRFCAADSIIARYFTIVKAGFAVSFTAPMLCLVMKKCDERSTHESEDTHFCRRTNVILCASPFVWAIPAVITPLPTLIRQHGIHLMRTVFFEVGCNIRDREFEIVSLVLMIVPLALGSIISMLFAVFFWKFAKMPLLSHSLGLLDITRILRFGALLLTIFLSVVFCSVAISGWVREGESFWDTDACRSGYTMVFVWEALTPILMFFIFGAQEEVYEVWLSWYRQTLGRLLARRHRDPESPLDPSYLDFRETSPRGPRALFHWIATGMKKDELDNALVQSSNSGRSGRSNASLARSEYLLVNGRKHELACPIELPPQIIPNPLLIRHSFVRNPNAPNSHDVMSLRPPPRPVRSRSESPQEGSSEMNRPFMNMPSLTAFGSKESSDKTRGADDARHMEEHSGQVDELQLYLSNPRLLGKGARPSTGESTDTFGNSGSSFTHQGF